MRDPNRIYKYCHELSEIWGKVYDWRFGQFMLNMITMCQYKGKDVFYMEDDELFEMMKNYFKENENAHNSK